MSEEKKDEKIVEEKKEEKDDFYDEKPKKKRSMVSLIINIVIWVVLLGWIALVLIDYFNVSQEKDPMFCWFNEHTTEYDNGTVTECTGLGYKVIRYNREDYQGIQFGPFWISDTTASNNK